MNLYDRLMGPHEWGYRDPATGDFIADGAPYEAAEALADGGDGDPATLGADEARKLNTKPPTHQALRGRA